MNRLYVLRWESRSRRYLPIGRLEYDGQEYRFAYTGGARTALKHADITALTGFPSLDEEYVALELFPFFSNRLISSHRPDFREFLEWLDATDEADNPLALLARSSGTGNTGYFRLMPHPEPNDAGQYEIDFFAQRLPTLSESSREWLYQLAPTDPLHLEWCLTSPVSEEVLILRSCQKWPDDCHVVGFVPRYFAPDILALKRDFNEPLDVRVVRVNPPPAPKQMRLLCRVTANWPAGFNPCTSADYQPIPQSAPHPH